MQSKGCYIQKPRFIPAFLWYRWIHHKMTKSWGQASAEEKEAALVAADKLLKKVKPKAAN